MFISKINIVFKEINSVLSKVKDDDIVLLIENILKSEKVVVVGAGRVGMAAKAFAMRLMHLGINAYTLGDSNLPSIGKEDLLVVCSGSGETQTIYDLTFIAKNSGVKIVAITANVNSRIAKLADHIVEIKAPTKLKKINVIESVQPMTTLMEQSLFLFFDALVLDLMEKLNISSDQMKENHSVLE